jgi:hypothetical protein
MDNTQTGLYSDNGNSDTEDVSYSGESMTAIEDQQITQAAFLRESNNHLHT